MDRPHDNLRLEGDFVRPEATDWVPSTKAQAFKPVDNLKAASQEVLKSHQKTQNLNVLLTFRSDSQRDEQAVQISTEPYGDVLGPNKKQRAISRHELPVPVVKESFVPIPEDHSNKFKYI